MRKTFLERERELNNLSYEAQQNRKGPRGSRKHVAMDERWCPIAMYEYEELFSRNAKEIIAVIKAASELKSASDDIVGFQHENCACVPPGKPCPGCRHDEAVYAAEEAIFALDEKAREE